MALLLISLFLLIPYAALILYYRQSWLQMKNYEIDNGNVPLTTVSVIIPARNEEKNIGRCIKSILEQTYAKHLLEVIVVDDYSTDQTVNVVAAFNKSNIRIIKLADIVGGATLNSYKKKAVETGIANAMGDLIITTDADCTAPAKWIETVVSLYQQTRPVLIVAPVSYASPAAGDPVFTRFFKIFQALDFMTLQGITGAGVSKKIHNMCNGANLAYERKVFYEVDGFKGIDKIASGDDMLLMHKIQKIYPRRITYLKSPEAIVQTKAASTVAEFINQRIRWASKADKYPDFKITAVLAFVYLFNAWILILAVISLTSFDALFLLVLVLVGKTFVEFTFLFPVANFFKSKKALWWFVPSQPFHIIYMLVAGWLGKFGTYTWKGRKVK